MKRLFKYFAVWWITFYLIVVPPVAHAVSPAGWAMTVFDLPTNTLTAVKNGVSASITAMPEASAVGSFAIKAVGSVAIAYAIAKYGGEAIDWVLDPANNQVKKRDAGGTCTSNTAKSYGSDILSACKSEVGASGWWGDTTFVKLSDNYYACRGTSNTTQNLAFINCTGVGPTVSADEIGNDILNKARAGDSAMANIVNGAMADEVDNGVHNAALDKAAADDAAHNCGTGTSWNGSACVAVPVDKTPPFDPSGIIDAIKSVFNAITALAAQIFEPIVTVINNAWEWAKTSFDWIKTAVDAIKTAVTDIKTAFTDFVDWFKNDPDPQTDSKPDIDTIPPTKSAQYFDSNYINFGGQCPSFSPTTISVGMVAVPISFNAQPLCDFAILCRPIILALAYFAAMAIVANAIRSE